MKIFAICLFVLTITFLTGLEFYSYSPTGIAETKVLDLMKELHQAEQNKDKEKLRQIFADKIFWSRYKDERTATREQAIENISNVECEVESIETEFVFTAVETDRVKVSFFMRQKFIWTDGNRSEHHADYTYTFENQHNEWKLTTIHLEN